MDELPPSTVRIVSHEAISPTQVRITMEMVVDVHRLAEICGELLRTTTAQTARSPRG
jgi:hypothetical protein